MWTQTLSFYSMGFRASDVNGWQVRDADRMAEQIAWDTMCEQNNELRFTDKEYFDFQVDWLGSQVIVTERELTN